MKYIAILFVTLFVVACQTTPSHSASFEKKAQAWAAQLNEHDVLTVCTTHYSRFQYCSVKMSYGLIALRCDDDGDCRQLHGGQ